MSTGMIIDGVFASQAIDSSGEILDIEGCDISTLDKDGIANYEHKEGDKKGSGNNGEEIVGKIVYAKKVHSAKDCDGEREQKYWDQVKVPFVYGMVRLYDGAGHSGAQALAAQVRDHHANNEPILVRFSIEGSTLERDGQRLKTSVARRVALTLKPCNRTAVSGLISDPRAPEGFEKKPSDVDQKKMGDILAGLVEKGEMLEHPAYMKLGGVHEVQCSPLVEEDHIAKSLKVLIKAKMLKAIAAGSYNAAPSSLTGGAALQREDRGLRARMKRAVTEYKPERGFNKGEFKAFAKTLLPEADDSFMDHFADVAHDYHMRRMKKSEELAKQEAPKAKKSKKVAAPTTTAEPEAPAVPEVNALLTGKAKLKKPKKLTAADIEPAALGPQLEAAMKATHQYKTIKDKKTGESRQELEKLVPLNVQGVKLTGRELARHLGIAAPTEKKQLTVRSQAALPYQEKLDEKGRPMPWFDNETGHLHVPPSEHTFSMASGKWKAGHTGGAIKFYIPGHYNPHLHGDDPVEGQKKANGELETFKRLLDDPERTKYHDTAMEHWSQAHQMLHEGRTPDELAMHAALFSMLSPNTPVPMHELMYGYLVDSMKHTGIDARDPKFGGRLGEKISGLLRRWRAGAGAKPDLQNPENFGVYGDWKGRDTGLEEPGHAAGMNPVAPQSHWDRIAHAIRLKNPKKGPEPRKQGMLGSFMLAQDKFGNMAKYAKNHQAFHKLFLEHGPKDPREIVNYLMHHKIEGGKFEAAKDRAKEKKKASFEYGGKQYGIDEDYPHGLVIEGLAPKTSRFAVTMAGAGNMWVPDTHMVRYNFGLEKSGTDADDDNDEEEDDDDSSGVDQKDKHTIKAIKSVLWNERHHHVMNSLDDYYIKHSPALDHMLARAEKNKWYIHGATPEEKRRNAAFGAFWKNWSAIKGHEESRGYQTGSSNDYSDHLPFWAAVKHLFKSEDDFGLDLPMRTAVVHAAWAKKYGEMGAQYMFMSHLLPQLLASHALRTMPATIRKFESLTIDLKKAIADEQTAIKSPEDQRVMFAGNPVVPGHALTGRGEYALLHEDDDHFIAVPHAALGDWCHHQLVKLPKAKMNTHYTVTRRPMIHVADME